RCAPGLPQNLPVLRKPAATKLSSAARADGLRPRGRPRPSFVLARGALGSSPAYRAAGGLHQHCDRRPAAHRGRMRCSRHRTARLAGSTVARSAAAGESHCGGDVPDRRSHNRLRRGPPQLHGARRMKTIKIAAIALLAAAALAAIAAPFLAPAGFEQQFRLTPDAGPSRHHPLGTDELGRDRLARLLYGMRVSFVLAPLAALITTVLAALLGGIAGCFGGWVESAGLFLAHPFLSFPWLFLLLTFP